jgi:hypothetical protein
MLILGLFVWRVLPAPITSDDPAMHDRPDERYCAFGGGCNSRGGCAYPVVQGETSVLSRDWANDRIWVSAAVRLRSRFMKRALPTSTGATYSCEMASRVVRGHEAGPSNWLYCCLTVS